MGIILCMATAVGCGATKMQQMTDQLLLSDAVDRTVAQIDFRVLAGKSVFLDIRHLKGQKPIGYVSSDYIISSIRQQMFAANVRLAESVEDAEFIVEARVGALGADGHEITYGLPATNLLSTAASVVPNAPLMPTIPEISVARRSDQVGGAKIALFAYHKKSKKPIWQSGVRSAMSNVRYFWVLGAGPFQRGTIYDGTQFAGSKVRVPLLSDEEKEGEHNELVKFDREHIFAAPITELKSPVQLSSFEDEAEADGADAGKAPEPNASSNSDLKKANQ